MADALKNSTNIASPSPTLFYFSAPEIRDVLYAREHFSILQRGWERSSVLVFSFWIKCWKTWFQGWKSYYTSVLVEVSYCGPSEPRGGRTINTAHFLVARKQGKDWAWHDISSPKGTSPGANLFQLAPPPTVPSPPKRLFKILVHQWIKASARSENSWYN